MPLTLGLTGGIASGKSLVGKHFEELGVVVVDGDQVSRDVVLPGSEGLLALTQHFGSEILDENGEMDRRRMREKVFNNSESRLELEGILHPLIRKELLSRRDEALGNGPHPYCILMVPLLVKFGWTELVDRLLVVDCPEDIQIQRLTARDEIDATLAQNMLASQDTRKQRLKAADDVIINTGTEEALLTPVSELHSLYRQLGSGSITQLPPQNYPKH